MTLALGVVAKPRFSTEIENLAQLPVDFLRIWFSHTFGIEARTQEPHCLKLWDLGCLTSLRQAPFSTSATLASIPSIPNVLASCCLGIGPSGLLTDPHGSGEFFDSPSVAFRGARNRGGNRIWIGESTNQPLGRRESR